VIPSATITPTTAASTGTFEITGVINYPNPYDTAAPLYIQFNTTRDCINIVFRLYTASFRRVLSINEGPFLRGNDTLQVGAKYLAGLSSGTYYYSIEGTDGSGKKTRSRIGIVIILRQ
jgi:hypothetical protein